MIRGTTRVATRLAPALLAAMAWAPAPARAAVEFGGSVQDGVGRVTELTFEATVGPGADRYLVVVITTSGPAATARIARWADTPLELVGGVTAPGGGCRVEWWGLSNPAVGTRPLRLVFDTPPDLAGASLLWYHGVDPREPVRGWITASGSQGPTGVDLVGVPDGLLLEATCGFSPDRVLALAGPAQTARWHWSIQSLSSAGSEARRSGPARLTWTSSTPGDFAWAAGGLTLIPAGAGAAGPDEVPLRVETAGCTLARARPADAEGIVFAALSALLLAILAAARRRRERLRQNAASRGTSRRQDRETRGRMPPRLSPVPRATPIPDEIGDDLDEVTFARAKNGDQAAQAALVNRYKRPVFSLLWRMVGPDRVVVEDLSQDTFLRVFRALRTFQYGGRARIITWILTIATRLAIDHLRAARPRHNATDALAELLPLALPRPDQAADRKSLARALGEAVDGLAPAFRAAFLLREVHGLAYDEIAAALDIDIGTVKSRLARARAVLQTALADIHAEAHDGSA